MENNTDKPKEEVEKTIKHCFNRVHLPEDERADKLLKILVEEFSQPKVSEVDKEVSAEEILENVSGYLAGTGSLMYYRHDVIKSMQEYGNKLLEAYSNKVQVSDAEMIESILNDVEYYISDPAVWINNPDKRNNLKKRIQKLSQFKQFKDKQ